MKSTDKPNYQDIVVKDINGSDVRIPVNVPWGTEKKLLPIIAVVYEKIPAIGQFIANLIEEDEEKKTPVNSKEFADNIPDLLRSIPDQLSEIAAVLTGKDTKWIEENLVFESLMGLISPFLSRVLGRFSGIRQQAQNIQQARKEKKNKKH
jgi:hypothetical protein